MSVKAIEKVVSRDEMEARLGKGFDVLELKVERLRSELYRAMMIQAGVIVGANTAIMGLLFSMFG